MEINYLNLLRDIANINACASKLCVDTHKLTALISQFNNSCVSKFQAAELCDVIVKNTSITVDTAKKIFSQLNNVENTYDLIIKKYITHLEYNKDDIKLLEETCEYVVKNYRYVSADLSMTINTLIEILLEKNQIGLLRMVLKIFEDK